jgi:purine-binding chemotaxis protein CheW
MTEMTSAEWADLWRDIDLVDSSRQADLLRIRLRERAQQYAAPLPDSVPEDRYQTVLAFELGNEQYAVDVMLVRAVRTLPNVTPVPGSPPFYRGVVNLRGKIVTLFDLRYFFDMLPHDDQPPHELIVVEANRLEMALVCHHVRGVTRVLHSEIAGLPDIRYTRGVTLDRLILLDIAALFEDDRLMIGERE